MGISKSKREFKKFVHTVGWYEKEFSSQEMHCFLLEAMIGYFYGSTKEEFVLLISNAIYEQTYTKLDTELLQITALLYTVSRKEKEKLSKKYLNEVFIQFLHKNIPQVSVVVRK